MKMSIWAIFALAILALPGISFSHETKSAPAARSEAWHTVLALPLPLAHPTQKQVSPSSNVRKNALKLSTIKAAINPESRISAPAKVASVNPVSVVAPTPLIAIPENLPVVKPVPISGPVIVVEEPLIAEAEIALPKPKPSGIRGVVMLGPTCPVVSYPVDPNCADRPYATRLQLTTVDGATVVQEFSSDENGNFAIEVPPGEYVIRSIPAEHDGMQVDTYPMCSNQGSITVTEGAFTDAAVACDSGIR